MVVSRAPNRATMWPMSPSPESTPAPEQETDEVAALRQRVAELEQELDQVKRQRDAVIAQVLPVSPKETSRPSSRSLVMALMVGALLVGVIWLLVQVLPRATRSLYQPSLPPGVEVRQPASAP